MENVSVIHSLFLMSGKNTFATPFKKIELLEDAQDNYFTVSFATVLLVGTK